jgi:hypothetical protein
VSFHLELSAREAAVLALALTHWLAHLQASGEADDVTALEAVLAKLSGLTPPRARDVSGGPGTACP